MKKNLSRKLNKETLRVLDMVDANHAQGGRWARTTGPRCSGHTVNAASCVVVPD
jgi:hypothetical protein